MKKSILAGILAFTLLLSLAACSGSNSNSGSGSGEAKASGSGLEKTEFNLGYLNSTAHLLAFVASRRFSLQGAKGPFRPI